MNSLWLAGLLALLVPPDPAQDPKPAEGKPASTNIRGAEYPRIHDDLRVTFRIKAPDAQKIEFGFFDNKRYEAKKGEDGSWTATTDPVVPGFHYYRMFIDGVQVNDPASQTFYGTGKDTSGIAIPKGVDFYLPKDVPHGEVTRSGWYFSKTTEDWRRIFVYSPPGYDSDRETRYPILYRAARRRRRMRPALAESRAMALHHGRPDRREEGEADARGHGAGLRRAGPAGRPPRPPHPALPAPGQSSASASGHEPHVRRSRDVMVKELIPMIDARPIARSRTATTARWPSSPSQAACRRSRSRSSTSTCSTTSAASAAGAAALAAAASTRATWRRHGRRRRVQQEVEGSSGWASARPGRTACTGASRTITGTLARRPAGKHACSYESPGASHEWLTLAPLPLDGVRPAPCSLAGPLGRPPSNGPGSGSQSS